MKKSLRVLMFQMDTNVFVKRGTLKIIILRNARVRQCCIDIVKLKMCYCLIQILMNATVQTDFVAKMQIVLIALDPIHVLASVVILVMEFVSVKV